MKRKRSMSTSSSSSFSSSSSSSPQPKRFDVFLSFRGEDTRNNFTAHLSHSLRRVGLFNIFKDDYPLEKGMNIGFELMSAIEDSHYAVVVLSENYATSSWCLGELAKIVEYMGDSGRIRTIFYHVDPSHVRNVMSTDPEKQQESSFWKALEEHSKDPTHSEYLESWRIALFTVGSQCGHPVQDHTDEAIFIEKFVMKISRELGASIRTMEGLFGMTSPLKELDSRILHSCANNKVCFVGIHGMGGIGKSTLARAYYKRMSHKFYGSSFLQNVREVCEKQTNGLVDLQRKLLSDILEDNFEEIGRVDHEMDIIRSRLRNKKVLIIIDDVSKEEQLNALVNDDKWFGSGSVIIVTSREDNFLKIRRYTIYRAEYLNETEALQLFSSKAFQSINPPKEYKELSKEVVKYANGLPLALTILGSLLGSKNSSECKAAMRRLRRCPEKEIVEKLKISFDDLNETDQSIFLDIACFFNGYHKDHVIQIMDSCGFDSEYGISNLDKSLLSVQNGSKLWMHDLLQEMGKAIVRKESSNELARQSRIWHAVDLYHVLENKEGINKVEAIVISLDDEILKYGFEGLSYMKNPRLLKILGFVSRFKPELKYLPNSLQYLELSDCCDNEFPSSFQARKLGHLKLWYSDIERLWNNRIKPFHNLKVIDLTGSESFSTFEDFTVVPNLESLILSSTKVSQIHPSIRHLKRLVLLDLSYCKNLEMLPKEMTCLASLQILNLNSCSKLCKLPDNLERLNTMRRLDMKESGITHLPSSIFLMENLKSFNCDNEKIMVSAMRENIISHSSIGNKCFLPHSFSSYITKLDLLDCNLTDQSFLEYFGKLECLVDLDLSKNPFTVLPPGIRELHGLKSLKLEYCERLTCLRAEHLPSRNLEEVYVNYCTSLSSSLDPVNPDHLRCSAYCLDCTELAKRQDGTMTALACLKRFIYQRPYGKFSVVFPLHPRIDHELPAWFIQQSSTAAAIIRLDPSRRNDEVIGFAMVLCFAANSSQNDFYCRIRFYHRTSYPTEDYNIHLGGIKRRRSDHLSIHYLGRHKLPRRCVEELESSSCENIEFAFYSDRLCGPCGIRLVYTKNIREQLSQIL